jgi:hypothetical protein
MVLKQWLILFIPLLIIIPIFINFSIVNKNPEELMNNAVLKASNFSNFVITADVIMDLGMMDQVMSYYSNTTFASSKNQEYVRMVTREPFTNTDYVTEQFVLNSGNYTCTNSYGESVCFLDNISLPVLDSLTSNNEGSFINLTYLGSKKINNTYCDIILSNLDIESIKDLTYGVNSSGISNLKDLYSYSCIDPLTGLTVESILSVKGESNYLGILIDVGINISKLVTSVSHEVPDSLFVLPYRVISPDELEVLINNSAI